MSIQIEEIGKELEEEINYIIERINNLNKDNVKEFLKDAIDIQIIKYICRIDNSGFSIVMNNDIEFNYIRGIAEVKARYGNIEITKNVDITKANRILEYVDRLTC